MGKKRKKNEGLEFNYFLDGSDKALHDKYKTIAEFLTTEFPKNNNPLSAKNETEIFNIRWNGHSVSIGRLAHSIIELKKILEDDICISSTDIRQRNKKDCHSKGRLALERKETYTIEYIKEITKDVLFEKDKRCARVTIDGDKIKGNSQRLQTFFTKGTKCVCCGIEGSFFAKEKHQNDISYHLNLYGYDENGQEVLMTKDHIIPRSKGGKDNIDNYQTMCTRCNFIKGNGVKSDGQNFDCY